MRVCIDTNILFAALKTGGVARTILSLSRERKISLFIAPKTANEIYDHVNEEERERIPAFIQSYKIGCRYPDAREDYFEQCKSLIPDDHDDAKIVAWAWTYAMEYFITWDKEHILDNYLLRSTVPLQFYEPPNFLDLYRLEESIATRKK